MLVTCPQCRRQHEWDRASPWRPFCSERCRLLDLGAWLQERYVIGSEAAGAAADEEPPRH
ncbi:MAG: DNA gyrase inhibitor YacG [Gammaproteobacteria bacterium]|nr:DNA gyrase inhibitor YacG [Gammaproteobacteria bacterium]